MCPKAVPAWRRVGQRVWAGEEMLREGWFLPTDNNLFLICREMEVKGEIVKEE